MPQTKVLKELEAHNVTYKILKHSDFGEVRSPQDFSSLANIPIDKIAKSLLLQGDDGYIMAVLPVAKRVDMEAIAHALTQEKIGVASIDDLSKVTGYERHATTALGLSLPTIIDSQLLGHDVIYVASGTIGEEVEIKPGDLVKLTKADVRPIAV